MYTKLVPIPNQDTMTTYKTNGVKAPHTGNRYSIEVSGPVSLTLGNDPRIPKL
jgi:hypothetical protein